MNNTIRWSFLIIVLLMPMHSARASEIRAFHNINQLPFKLIYGLPSLDNTPLTETGKLRLNILTSISNTYDATVTTQDVLLTDLETLRTSLILSYAVRNNLQIGFEIPYIRHNGGFLDDFIYDWHEFFGMPQNDRTKSNTGQMQVQYLSTSGAAFALSDSGDNLGDIRLNSAYTRPWGNRSLIFSAELKLPTGDFDKLTGSGGVDISAGLTLNDPVSFEKYNITLFCGLAGIFLDDIDGSMSIIQNNFALAARAGLGWQTSRILHLKLQLDAHTPLYDTDIKELGDPGLQIVMGGSLFLTDDAYIDLSVTEDLSISTGPDITFQLALIATY